MNTRKVNKKSRRNKTHKKRHLKKRTTCNRVAKGGTNVAINLQQIAVTPCIIDAVKKYAPGIIITNPTPSYIANGFPLARMENMMTIADYDNLLLQEPVKIKKLMKDGRPVGKKINGTMKPLYEIVDGRHRVARAIIENKETIQATVTN